MPSARVAVTGAGGLIGRPLVAALAVDDRIEEVVAIDARRPDGQPAAKVRWVQRDTRDPRIAEDLEGVDAVVHLAFRVVDVSDAVSVNVDGSRNVFEGAVAAGASTIVHASSAAVYGAVDDNPVPLREEHPMRADPAFVYPRTKMIVEGMLEELGALNPALRVVRIRPTTTLGPGAAPLLLAGWAYVSLSDFDPPMQFTWADDTAAAFVAALHAPAAAGVFNVGAPRTVPASEVARILGVRSIRLPYRARRGVAAAMQRLRIPGGLHPGFVDLARYPIVVSSARAEAELGWRAERDSEAVLRRYAQALT